MKRAIIIGASSGIGRQVAQLLIQDGWHVGLAARRKEILDELKPLAPERICTKAIDITAKEAPHLLKDLISDVGGMNLFFHAAGTGWQNPQLTEDKELKTMEINAMGFSRMIGEAFRYFATHTGGHIAVISSIAGTKGLGAAPAYSASKALQNTYIEALEQLSAMRKLHITFTDIRPGFVDTALLTPSGTDTPTTYPMLMSAQKVSKLIVKAIYKKRHVVVIDYRWRILTTLWRCVPSFIWRRLRFCHTRRKE